MRLLGIKWIGCDGIGMVLLTISDGMAFYGDRQGLYLLF